MPVRSTHAGSWLRSPTFWILAISVMYLVAQVLLFDESRYLEWDEAEYLARSSAQIADAGWGAHRALGTVWIISPISWIGWSLVVLRWYLAVVSTLALGFAFYRWVHPVGMVAPIGMAIFASSWLALFYGSEISPNLYIAAAAVGATGSLATYVVRQQQRDLIFIAGFVGAAVMLRPSDAAVLAAGLGLAAILVLKPSDVVRVGVALLTGFVIGVIPWVIESYRYFGGPLDRLATASRIVGGGFTLNLTEHLMLADGPIFGPDLLRVVSPMVLAVFGVSSLIAIYGASRRELRPAVQIALGVSVIIAMPYLVYMNALAPRFLLPSIALASIPMGMGVMGLLDRHVPLGVLAVGFLVLASVWSVTVAMSVHEYEYEYRDVIRIAGVAMAERTGGSECYFLSAFGSPSLAVETGCEGQHLVVDRLRCQVETMRRRSPGSDILVILRDSTEVDEFKFLTPVSDSGLPRPLVLFNVPAGSDTGCQPG